MKYCEKCGQEIGNNKICANCGHRNKYNKTIKAVVAIICCISIITVGVLGVLRFSNKDTISNTNSDYVFFTEDFTDVLITDEKSAIEAVASVGNILGIKDASSELKVVFTNIRGTETYYRLQQCYNNIPVFGRNITVVADENGKPLALTANYLHIEDIDTEPSLNEEKVKEKITKAYGGVDSQINNGLIVYTLYDSTPTLAYDVIVSKSNENNLFYEQCIISAENGDVLFENNLIRTDIEHSLDEYTYKVNDKTYLMYDASRNILVLNSNKKLLDYKIIDKDNTEYLAVSNDGKTNENDNPLWDKNQTLICGDIKIEGAGKAKWKDDAVDLINSIENTYDFYSTILNWNGYDNKNSPLLSSYNDFFYSKGNNAYSQGNLLVFGYEKDLTDVGLIGHEFTHSVEGSISGMLYSGESGAIMEAYSDIFGELAEDYAKDGMLNGDCDWIHGSRNMINPSVNNYPASYMDDNWGSTVDIGTDSDHGSVHTNNTVISHAAYLMSSGVNGNARIDNKSLAVMWFNALNMLQADADFSQSRNAVELSARIMVKNKQLTEEQYRTVKAAFDVVGIEEADFTYSSTVKNKFDLSVLSSKESENVSYELEIIKILIKPGPDESEQIMEKTSLVGKQSLDLENGVYIIRITDINDKDNISQTISMEIVVDGNDSDATDEVVVYTDFMDVITVVIDEAPSEFKSGDHLIEIDGKIICAKDDGIYYKESVNSTEKKIISASNVTSMLSDGQEIYYVTYEETVSGTETSTLPHTIHSVNIDGSQHNEVYSIIDSGMQVLNVHDGYVYWLEQFNYGDGTLNKVNISSGNNANLGGEVIKEYNDSSVSYMGRICDKLYFLNKNYSGGKNREAVISYDLNTEKSDVELNNLTIDFNDRVQYEDKLYFKGYTVNENYDNTDCYFYIIDSNNEISKSIEIPSDLDVLIMDNSCKYIVCFNDEQSDIDTMFDMYRVDLKTGDVITSKGEAGRYKNKNYFVTYDLANPEDIYFMYNVGLYDKGANKIVNKKHDDFEIDIMKPMWIINGYVVDSNINTYKIYDESNDASNIEKISSDEAVDIARKNAGGDGYGATYVKNVEYNGEEYYLINIKWRVDDGDGTFHYSHIGYSIVSLDGKDVKNADYINGQVQVY